ncbi:HEAT repeat domain-containing protein [Streptomyces sp. NPDC001809]
MGDGTELVAAVRRGDAEAVAGLLEAGVAPDTLADDGLPVLCLAVAARDAEVASALVEGGADPDRPLPDGSTPLVRAVEGGSPAVASAVLGPEPRLRLPEAERERLLALARRWYERGAEAELRDRTGASGPVERSLVSDDEFSNVRRLVLGGVSVHEGYGAILTHLEWAFRILTPVDELVARAVAHRDRDHVDRSAARGVLGERLHRELWTAVTAHRSGGDPERRLFVVDFLHWCLLIQESRRNRYDAETAELLAAWAVEGDADPEVLGDVLRVLAETDHPAQAEVGLRYAGHPAPCVRAEVPWLLLTCDSPSAVAGPEARAALLALAADPSADVRRMAGRALAVSLDGRSDFLDAVVGLLRDPDTAVRACVADSLADGPDRTPAVGEALVPLLDEDEFLTRLNAGYGLLRRDHPRTGEAVERLRPLSRPGFEHDHRLSALWTWDWQRTHGSTE